MFRSDQTNTGQATHRIRCSQKSSRKLGKGIGSLMRSWIWFLSITLLHRSVAVQKHVLIKTCKLQYFPIFFYFVLNLPFLFNNHSSIQEYKWKLSVFPFNSRWISFAFRTSLNFTLLFFSFLTYWRGLHTNICSLLILQEYAHFFAGASVAVLLMKSKQQNSFFPQTEMDGNFF